jgi:tRNA modification GTPase
MNVMAQLTATGSAAIAVIALEGPQAWQLIRPFFRSKQPLPESPLLGRFWVGTFGETNSQGDEIILSCPPSGGIEIHCHGGIAVIRWLCDFLSRLGFQQVEPWKLARTSTINAQAWHLLGRAVTKKTAGILLDQAVGPDRETTPEEIASFQHIANHLIEPFQVALVGRPNVGKSSLLNALAGYQRSIVAPIAGTTRDLVSLTIALDGWPVTLTDTAGLREAGDVLESLGIEKSRQAIQSSDLVVYLVEPNELATFDPQQLPSQLGISPQKLLIVLNKEDLLQGPPPSDSMIAISCLHKTGLELLSHQIIRRLVPVEPKSGQKIPLPNSSQFE